MTAGPGELSATAIIGLIEAGSYPRQVVETIARGFLPLAQEDLIAVLAYVAQSEDAELAALARASLAEVPSRVVLDFASSENTDPDHLTRLMTATADPLLLEALIRNRALPDLAVVDLARHADGRVQEVIVINQARILRAPSILDALLENPALTTDARRRALETREEFFEKKARAQAAREALPGEDPELVDAPLDAIADLLEAAAHQTDTPSAPPALTEAEKKDSDKAAIWTRLQFMSVSEKVQLAYRGDRMVRMLLVRERNKLICGAVMRNPRMSEQEAEAVAAMRNVEEEVLRLLALRRDWMSKYNILVTLCRNPKTPVGVVLPLINRLTLRDLKGLRDDKGVQNVVRETARKVYQTRAAKAG